MNRAPRPYSSPAARFLGVVASLLVTFASVLSAPATTVAVSAIASDAFTRSVATGWGTLDTGQTWYITNGNDVSTDVNGSVGQMVHTTIGELKGRVLGSSVADIDITATFRAEVAGDDAPTTNTEFILYSRYEPEPNFRYYLRLVLSFVVGSTSPVLRVDRQATEFTSDIAHVTLPATNDDPTVAWKLRLETAGPAIRGKAWLASGSEPANWQLDFNDYAVSAANQFGVGTFTNDVTPTMTIDVDDFTVTAADLPPLTDIDASAFKNDIIWLWYSGITTGCSPTTYCPDDPVTRGQMAAFLVRAFELPPTATDYFTDDSGSTFQDDINRLAASGITKGCTPTTFCPNATVTRGQMAAFLDRAFGLAPTGTDYFTDDNGSTFETDINRLAASGITKGCTPTTYCPASNVTRGQMAAFLHRGLLLFGT